MLTEKEMELRLVEEVREVTQPDGSTRRVRLMNLHWRHYELVLQLEQMKPESIAELAQEVSKDQGVAYDKAFAGVIAHFSNRWYDLLDKFDRSPDDFDEEDRRQLEEFTRNVNG